MNDDKEIDDHWPYVAGEILLQPCEAKSYSGAITNLSKVQLALVAAHGHCTVSHNDILREFWGYLSHPWHSPGMERTAILRYSVCSMTSTVSALQHPHYLCQTEPCLCLCGDLNVCHDFLLT